jgi:hypothetical protein
MARFKRSSRFRVLAIALTVALMLGFAANLPARVQAQLQPDSLSSKLPNQWEFTAPRGPGNPIPLNRQGGATRSNDCLDIGDSLMALVPASVGTTAAEYPTIYWYMPKTSASTVEFMLRDENQQTVYSTKFALAKSTKGMVLDTPRIMSLSLPAFSNLSPLKIGQEYQWLLVLTCNPLNFSENPFVEGRIKRVEADPNLERRISQATPQERVALYAEARLWYETVATLVELQRDRPNSQELKDAINKLLTSVELNTIATQPNI